MPLSTVISLPPNVQQMITSAAAQLSVDPNIASALAQVVSGGVQLNSDGSTFVSNWGIGVMGISDAIGQSLGYDVSELADNIQAGVQYLANLVQQFVGNYSLAVSAYLSSPTLVLTSNGIPPLPTVQSAVYNINQLAALNGSTQVNITRTLQSQTSVDPEPNTSAAQNLIGSQTTGTDYGQVSAQNTALLAQSLTPALQDDTGLSETPWYQTQNLITGNPKVRNTVQPVQFIVYLDRNNSSQVLHNPQSNSPIVLQLNCSMREFTLESKHIYQRTPSRTGMHVTLWGMQPDLFQGAGSTGVFMNQFGITDYFSVANYQNSPDIINKVESAFTAINATKDLSLLTLPDAFRVAAQDAFLEFLKLFQMNGNVWYRTQNYQGVLTEQEQQSPNAWSPKTGASSFQQHSRNNDVMTRGYVAMKFKNNVYLGYFKSLNWTMDANKPFSWDFSFTFQIEQTYSALYWPSTPATTTTYATNANFNDVSV